MNRLPTFIFAIIAAMPVGLLAGDAEWGDLTGRFFYDGDPPPTRSYRATKDRFALGGMIKDESLVVNKRNSGVSNIVIYLLPNGDDELCVHPSYARTANDKVELTMTNGRFVPHVLLMRTTQTMVQHNKDKVPHNANIVFRRNAPM